MSLDSMSCCARSLHRDARLLSHVRYLLQYTRHVPHRYVVTAAAASGGAEAELSVERTYVAWPGEWVVAQGTLPGALCIAAGPDGTLYVTSRAEVAVFSAGGERRGALR